MSVPHNDEEWLFRLTSPNLIIKVYQFLNTWHIFKHECVKKFKQTELVVHIILVWNQDHKCEIICYLAPLRVLAFCVNDPIDEYVHEKWPDYQNIKFTGQSQDLIAKLGEVTYLMTNQGWPFIHTFRIPTPYARQSLEARFCSCWQWCKYRVMVKVALNFNTVNAALGLKGSHWSLWCKIRY